MGIINQFLALMALRYAVGKLSAGLTAVGLSGMGGTAVMGLLTFTVLVCCLWYFQEKLLYMPSVPNQDGSWITTPADNPEGLRSPDEQGLPSEEPPIVAADGVKIHAWFIPASDPNAPTLMFSHENAGNVGLRLQEFKELHARCGCHILAYDYRGYGFSGAATIEEEGIMLDAHAAWRWVVGRVARPELIFLYGRSLGGAVSVRLARELCEAREAAADAPLPAGLILCNTFTSIQAMLAAKYWLLDWGFVRRYLLRMRWRSIEHIGRVALPLLMMVGDRDEIVPSEHTDLLRRAAVAALGVQVHRVADGTHNDTWMRAGPAYFQWLRAFIDNVEHKAAAPVARDEVGDAVADADAPSLPPEEDGASSGSSPSPGRVD